MECVIIIIIDGNKSGMHTTHEKRYTTNKQLVRGKLPRSN